MRQAPTAAGKHPCLRAGYWEPGQNPIRQEVGSRVLTTEAPRALKMKPGLANSHGLPEGEARVPRWAFQNTSAGLARRSVRVTHRATCSAHRWPTWRVFSSHTVPRSETSPAALCPSRTLPPEEPAVLPPKGFWLLHPRRPVVPVFIPVAACGSLQVVLC